MLIVVEGPDGAGKSTLCDKLRSELQGYVVLVRTNSKPRTDGDIYRVAQWLKQPTVPVVCDRHPFISDLVYSWAIRERKPLHNLQISDIARRLSDSLVIYCRPPMGTLYKGLESHPQMDGVLEKYDALVRAYDQVLFELADVGLPSVEYNYEDPRMRITERVQEFIIENTL